MSVRYSREKIEQNQIDMFGQTIKEFEENLFGFDTSDWRSCMRLAETLLTDAQEKIVEGDKETARRWINLAKYYNSEAKSIMLGMERTHVQFS